MDVDIYVTIRRDHPKSILNMFTTKQVSIERDPKSYSMLEQLKNTHAKISLYDLISTSKKYIEIIYELFKKEKISTNSYATLFFEKKIIH